MRLSADWQKIRNEFSGHPFVKVEPAAPGIPPERYIVTFNLPGLVWDSTRNAPVAARQHVAEIYLHADYPREKPKCVLKTPIWHPNFGSFICIGDHWAAGETLVDVIVQIGDMIQYKTYNPKSPLNAAAARWAVQNRNMLPVGNINILQPEVAITLGAAAPARDDLEIQLF
jgi:hypothetical protein